MTHPHMPKPQGLYDPRFEHDACGVGFVCNIDGRKSHDVVQKGLQVLVNLTHRGAAGADGGGAVPCHAGTGAARRGGAGARGRGG